MVRAAPLLLLGALALSLAGCARNEATRMAGLYAPRPSALAETKGSEAIEGEKVALLGFQPDASGADAFPLRQSFRPSFTSKLAGRTIAVSRISDIQLADKEVVLTFDDGPMPGKTLRILKALDDYGVGATFLMVGRMADAYPKIAQAVAERGHTIGTHTESHANLRSLDDEAAMAEIRAGQISVAEALQPIGREPAPFFRFPYLADRPSLRQRIANQGVVAIDVDIDSKDYFHGAPSTVKERTILDLEKHGRGIILFHDIHERTVDMLPDLLASLQARGFKVVRLVPGGAPLLAAAKSAPAI
ncbi:MULTISPECIES: polysaccharide deacetylase family protein [unclassified Aureimonas]|uniref:polysaccharide deacetylase family protein n=1 Tax=unclassified Aureimonas TaxID=2615206 RepID=UPI00070179BF|nr:MULTISPECIES: polysaccharide deacetylase family protein [unclassified Aureimonas]KQT61759.1 hypothetical protein ASG54_23885 [Aureimonas sp. Leaf460]KQT65715.1 hypothetical protein ASG62_21990 [Aureimonas sp. Leaf427]